MSRLLFFTLAAQYCAFGSVEDKPPGIAKSETFVINSPMESNVDNGEKDETLPTERSSTRSAFSARLASICNLVRELIASVGQAFARLISLFWRAPSHPSVAVRPLREREDLTPVQLIFKGVDITLKRQTKDNEEMSEPVCSLLHEQSIMEQKKLIVCEKAKKGFCRLKRRLFIEIRVPRRSVDLSAQAAYTAIRLLYQSVLRSVLLPGSDEAVERFVFDEYPYIRCYGMCDAFHKQYTEIMHGSVGLLWEAVEAIDVVRAEKSVGNHKSFEDFIKELAKKKQILLVNRVDEYRLLPLPAAA
ncbi:hypothetical protein XU18_0425 [Perkinsela sp. CCAP 1560/4]|nr:hypothetical protein XU18_0425 [Perkinsela sp. CCAP 1560/4]|eukprot:KNH09740.1 hypothetical protein XU18_0425 [Perkinsela sp. CCAP 1560/4]